MNKKLNDRINVGSEQEGSKKIINKQSGNKGSVQSGDNSAASKKVSNIHRQ